MSCYRAIVTSKDVKRHIYYSHIVRKLYPFSDYNRISNLGIEHIQLFFPKNDLQNDLFLVNVPNSDMR